MMASIDGQMNGKYVINMDANPIVTVHITCKQNNVVSERRFNRSMDISTFKIKLEPITGINAGSMLLTIYPQSGNTPVGQMDDDSRLLGYYPIENYMRIEVSTKKMVNDDNGVLNSSSLNIPVVDYNDVSKVEKMTLADEDYDKRSDTVRSFLRRNKLGKFSDDACSINSKSSMTSDNNDQPIDSEGNNITIGSRFETKPKSASDMAKRGSVMFIGETDFKPGLWIGIEYDEPYGTHNGEFQGKQYFKCRNKHGAFIRPQLLVVGDFPEELFDLDDLDEI